MTSAHQMEVQGPDKLDFDAFARFQSEVFSELLKSYGAHNVHLCPEYFRWKYEAGCGPGRVAVLADGKQILSTNSMLPYRIRTPLGTRTGWQSCDTATLPSARGQGLFPRCLSALTETIHQGELFFGFPNHNSIRGFLKLGWTVWCDVDCWVRPLVISPWSGRHDPRVSRLERFGPEQDLFNEAIAQTGWSFLERDASYLNWRYMDHPVFDYESYVLMENDNQRGFAVVREAKINRLTFLILMEFWGLEERDETSLLAHCIALAAERGLRHVALLDTAGSTLSKLINGVIPIPRKLLPKKQTLMGQLIGQPKAPLHGLSWRSQFGDWDSF